MSASTDPHLRIVFVVSADQKTGTYFRYHNLAVCLQRRGHTVTVLSQASHRFGWKSETRDRVEYILAPSFPGNRWLYFSSNPMNLLYRHLRSAPEADVFHLFQPFPNAAWSWLRLRKTRRASLFAYDWDDLLLNEHSSLLLQRTFKDLILGKLAQWTELHLPRFAHLVTAISQELALLATKRGARWVELLHNGCLPSDPPTRAAARAQLGLKPDALYLGFTGWAAPEMDWILNAVAKLVDEHPRLRIAFSGVHPNDVVDLSLVPGVAERIDYFRFETAEECRVLQSALDLGLLPLADIEFNRYRLPMKFHDYLACGTPIVCCEVGEAGRLGLTMPGVHLCPATPEGWEAGVRQAIAKLLAGKLATREEILQAAAKHSWDAVAERLETLYLTHARPVTEEAQQLNSIH